MYCSLREYLEEVEIRTPVKYRIELLFLPLSANKSGGGLSLLCGMGGDGRSGKAVSASFGVTGNDSELAELGRRDGRTGIVNVFGISVEGSDPAS